MKNKSRAEPFRHDRRTGYPIQNREEIIDGLMRSGQFALAKDELIDQLTQSSRDEVRFMMKFICLPLYEIEWNDTHATATTPELLSDAETIHSNTVALVSALRDKYSRLAPSKSLERGRTIGNLSEATVLALGARQFNQSGNSYILPSSYVDDHSLSHANDLRLSYRDKTRVNQRLQIKTRRTQEHTSQYASHISVIGINDLDPRHYASPWADNSIHNQLILEINGTLPKNGTRSLNKKFDALMRQIYQ